MNIILILVLTASYSYAAKEKYEVNSTITLRTYDRGNNHLIVAADLAPGSTVTLDMDNEVDAMRYLNSNGNVKRSRSGWIRGVKVVRTSGGSSAARLNRKPLFLSVTHLGDISLANGNQNHGGGQQSGSKLCAQISRSRQLKRSTIGTGTKHGITQYFTPKFPSLSRKHRGKPYRYWCLKIEGSCIVGNTLWNYPNRSYNRSKITCKYGYGNRRNGFNTTNCLNPCRTVAADQSRHKTGTVIYIPGMKGKICPHNGKRIDGCFIVGDVGSAIKGKGRFDLFTGICRSYNGGVCNDSNHSGFRVPKGSKFYYLNRTHSLAKKLRRLSDRQIKSSRF